jgi:anti-sigma B factor antagonist
MNVSTRQREGITVIDLEGKITIGRGDIALHDAFKEAVSQGARKVLFNFARVTQIDSSGMAELGVALQKEDKMDGKISLTKLPSNVEAILHMTLVDTLFDVYETEDEAIKAMQ